MVHLPIQILFIMARRNEQPTCENCSNRMRSVFCDLHGNELESLNESKGCGDYKKGQIIFNAGAYPHGLYCVNEGKIKIYRVGDEGKEQIIRLAKGGDILGYRALLSGDKYSSELFNSFVFINTEVSL